MLVLNLFIPEYLDKILPWKEMKIAFSVRLQTEFLCFCFRQKLEKTQAAQTRNIMQSLSTFIRISGSALGVKKSALISDHENIAYSEKPEQGEV